jgi:phosphate transport system permease protein
MSTREPRRWPTSAEPSPPPAPTISPEERRRRFEPRRHHRYVVGRSFEVAFLLATLVGVLALLLLLIDITRVGAAHVSWNFIDSFPSRFPERAGIKASLVGSLWILGLTAAMSFPLGIATSVWLEEYAPRGWVTRTIQANIANLAAVPSIVYGILGLAVFVRWAGLGRSLLAGSLTLTLLILPVIIIAAQEAIRAVPPSIRQASYALGATRWQTVSRQVLPMALPGIMTGTILALSRAVGETAPLIIVGAVGFVPFLPEGVLDAFSVLPIQIFDWISRPQPAFHELAAAGILVLLAVLMTFNMIAILLRNRFRKRF